MSLTPMLIAPFQTGLETDVEPWIAPPDSFTIANNVHVRHGYVEKRSGYRILAALYTTDSTVGISNIAQDINGTVTTAAPHGYSTGNRVYIAGVTGMTEVNNQIYSITVTGANSFELGISTVAFGAYVAGGTSALLIASSNRVMGIFRYNQADGTFKTLAFTTQRAFILNGVTKTFDPLDSANIMSGSQYDYIWATNWQGTNLAQRLYFTNGKQYDGASLDGIRFYDASGTGQTTTLFTPDLNPGATRQLYGSKLLFVLKQRLIALHTFENDSGVVTAHPQRARWCQAQGPSNWDDITPGGGGFVDCPTGDQIISARALQNSIIVQFTNSVWTLRPVPDPALPFRWDKINDFRAVFGKMASVGYDRDVKAIGDRGITATDGTETARIDRRITDFVNDVINTNEVKKIYCARSYAKTRWWTLYPDGESAENNAALIYDDESGAFTTYSISMNCLGYGNFEEDYGLNDFTSDNNLDINLLQAGDADLQSYFWQDDQELFLGGDTAGVVYIMEFGGDDLGIDIETTLETAAWAPYKEQGMEARMSYLDFFIDTDVETEGTIHFYKDNDIAPYMSQSIDFLPNLDYVASIVNANATNPVQVIAPNHGLETGETIFIYRVKGMVELNDKGYQVTVVNNDTITLDGVDGTGFTAYTTGGIIVRRPFYKTKTWKRAYAGGIGYQHRIRFESTGSEDPYRIHAFKPYFSPVGKRTIN